MARPRGCLPTIILPLVVHQSKSLSDKRSTPAGGRDLSSSGPNPLDAHIQAIYEWMIDALRRGAKVNTAFLSLCRDDSGLTAGRRRYLNEDFRRMNTA